MPKLEVTIQPAVLDWIMQQSSADEAVFPDIVDTLQAWRTGTAKPTFHKVEEISKKTRIPFGYFFMARPPVETNPLAEYRTIGSSAAPPASRNLLDTIDAMLDVQGWMADFYKENGYSKLPFVGRFEGNRDKKTLIRDILEVLTLSPQWYQEVKDIPSAFKLLREKTESVGILVMMSGTVRGNTHRKLMLSEFRAFTLINGHAPLIFINAADAWAGRLFSLMHEIVHIWIGRGSLFNELPSHQKAISSDEQFCNAIAAEVLVPEKDFEERWKTTVGRLMDKVEALAKYFKCSRFVVARRALDHHYMTHEEYAELSQAFQKKWDENDKKSKGGGNYYKTLQSRFDRNFIRALASSVWSGTTQYTDAYRLTDVWGKSFEKLVEMTREAR